MENEPVVERDVLFGGVVEAAPDDHPAIDGGDAGRDPIPEVCRNEFAGDSAVDGDGPVGREDDERVGAGLGHGEHR